MNDKVVEENKSPAKEESIKSIKRKIKIELNDDSSKNKKAKNSQFIYGNYSQYYGYRNQDKDVPDWRLKLFESHRDLFAGKDVLDIGCNNGFITIAVAQQLQVKKIIGIDIDSNLIKAANKKVLQHKRKTPIAQKHSHGYPHNISFLHANYILKHDCLLEIEESRFDVILCLSVTKWVHLNFGDAGLKQAFRRMFLQIRPGGILILEAQHYGGYHRRKKMTETIFENYKAIKLFPKDFAEYLLSEEIGFSSVELIDGPEGCAKSFQRPIQIFHKSK